MKQDKKEYILEVAERVFGKLGYEGASTRHLATEAGVNIAMLHYYFGSKDGLFKAVLERRINVLRQALLAIKEKPISTWDKLMQAVEIYLERVLQNNGFHRLIQRELSLNQRPEITQTITEQVLQNTNVLKTIIQEGIDNGTFRPVDIEMTIASILGTKYYISNSSHISSRLLQVNLTDENIIEVLKPRLKHFLQDFLQAYLLKNEVEFSLFIKLEKKLSGTAASVWVPFLSLHVLMAPAQNAKVLTLSEAIDLGVRNSKNLKLAQAKIDQAISRYKQAQDSRLPTGSVSYTYNHAEILANKVQLAPEADPFYLPKHANAAIGTAGLQEVIFAGNKLHYARESTQLLTDIARLDAEKDQEDIVYNITNAYYNLYKLQQSKKIVDQNLQAIDRQIKQAQRFFEQGIVTKNDVLRFQLQRSNVELSGVDLETNRKIVVYNLAILLGLPENTDLQTEQLPANNIQMPVLTTFIESALANRQELKSLILHGQVADLNIKSIKADVRPTVLVGANAYYLNLKGPFLPQANSFLTPLTANATIAWNFDKVWLNKNKVSEARIQKTQSDISRELTTDQIKTEVNQYYQNYVKALERIRILETAILQAQENDRTTASQYQNKVATATERVDAQTELFQAQINLELARADAEIAYYTLLKSTGKISQK